MLAPCRLSFLWSGHVNISRTIYKNNIMLEGKPDWFTWKPVADYSGVDGTPE